MKLYHLNQTVLRISNNASQFLNGLTSNSLDRPFNAFLNVHGRIITTFYQQKISDQEYLIAVPDSVVTTLLSHLDRYAKLNRTQIEKTNLKAYLDLEGNQILFKEDFAEDVSTEEFTRYRLDHFMPLLGIDYQVDEFLLNIDETTFVSYTKGCFLGQEPVAKVHNRSKPSRRLVVKFEEECTEEEKAKMSSKIFDPATGKIKGFVFVKNM